jgi:hypothetical protein
VDHLGAGGDHPAAAELYNRKIPSLKDLPAICLDVVDAKRDVAIP